MAARPPRGMRPAWKARPVSSKSSSEAQRTMPYLRHTALNTSSSPASAPVWLRVAALPSVLLPIFTIRIGFSAARAFSAAAMKASGRRMPSTMATIIRVSESSTMKLM